VPKILLNMAAGHLSMRHGYQGPVRCITTACATGADSVGDAFTTIRLGRANVMLAGGAEACVHPLALAGFSKVRSLSTIYNDAPNQSCRPFDRDRDGFVIAEGAAMLILEELEHALRRGAHLYAEVRGWGSTGDAYHPTAPRPDGQGALRAMRSALKEAGISPRQVDYINAHATGTLVGDVAEVCAIKELLRDVDETSVTVSSTKGATGHLLGAAGALEALFTVLAVHEVRHWFFCLPHPSSLFQLCSRPVLTTFLEDRTTNSKSGESRCWRCKFQLCASSGAEKGAA
jgi:3-oxoacyl-[acyl-carrier-protein] synthase II